MHWILLITAGLLEIIWAVGLKYTEGFTRLTPSIITIIAMVASMALLGLAMRHLPLGTAYAIWTGIGIAGTAVLGIIMFGESASAARIVCIVMILGGIIGLKLLSPA